MRNHNNAILIDDPVDLNASHYVKNSSLQNSLAKKILANYRFNKHASILDVGCGDGRITAELAIRAKQGQVIGLDPSPSMIEFASNNFSKKQFPNLDFQLGMAEDVSFFQQFDLVVSFSCFHWLRDAKRAVSQLSSSLKQGGEMLILTYPKESAYYQYLETALKNYPEYRHFSANNTMLSINDYKKLFPKYGLDIFDFHEQKLFAVYNNPQDIKEYIRGWLDSYVHLPDYLYDSFLSDTTNAILTDPSTKKGKQIRVPYTALVIKAKKLKTD
jgi:SAM-dependent methyltransferase